MTHEPTRPGAAGERVATVIETDEEIRRALLSRLQQEPTKTGLEPLPAAVPERVARGASMFRPTVRPPIALLTVFDDGKTDGEVIRIRDTRFIIGRSEGDLRIPIDGRISARHAQITLQTVGGHHRWVVTDLQSTHGLFVRVSRTVLADKAEVLVGTGRYRFDAAQLAGPGPAAVAADHGATQAWDGAAPAFRPPALSELLGAEIGNRLLLVKPEYWIGSDPSCAVCRPDDPFCEPRHARVYQSPQGNWLVEHNKTANGLWLRMAQVVVEAQIQFQIGEQRFRLKIG